MQEKHELHPSEQQDGQPTKLCGSSQSYSSTSSKILFFPMTSSSTLVYVLVLLLLYWYLPRHTLPGGNSSYDPTSADIERYFDDFQGSPECKVQVDTMYIASHQDRDGSHTSRTFCRDRDQLLQALSDGGRMGFDSPYLARGCDYKWFSVEEICFLLDRFDGLVFIGDEPLQTVYNGFNILLQKDLASGAMDLDLMDERSQDECRCDHQFTKAECQRYYIVNVTSHLDKSKRTKFLCDRLHHGFLNLHSKDPEGLVFESFNELVPRAPRSQYRPIPIIHSLSPATASIKDATASLARFIKAADESERDTPMLWIGPTAAGHIELKGRKGNQEIWDFDKSMAEYAVEHDVEVLRMWNLTVQANSWDGMRFGEDVAITQAMMVLNWLSRVDSS